MAAEELPMTYEIHYRKTDTDHVWAVVDESSTTTLRFCGVLAKIGQCRPTII